jgi:arylesterase / paraoxonase
MRITKEVGIAIAVIVIAVGFLVFDYLQHGGWFKTLKPYFAGNCETIALKGTVEDISIDHERGLAFLSYVAGERGTVMLLDLNVTDPRVRAALTTEPASFRPRGLGFQPSKPRRLYVVSGADASRTIEVFEETETGAFAPLETIRDPLLTHADDIAAVGAGEFYVSGESGAGTAWQRLQERLFRRGLSTITYSDGQSLRVVAERLKRTGGIAVSNHGLWVYVGESDANQLRIFDRDSGSGSLEPRNIVELGSAPESVSIDADGTVWITAHPKLLALREHLREPSRRSPTAIYRLRTSVIEKEERLSIPFLDSGERISAGSVVAVHGRRMLVGSLTERKILLCTLPERL